MSAVSTQQELSPPASYQEWLHCLEVFSKSSATRSEICAVLRQGTFSGSPDITKSLCEQIVKAINEYLDYNVKRFARNLNESIAFNEFLRLDLLFRRLKKDINAVMFFESLGFLPEAFREELKSSVKNQMSAYWKQTVLFLHNQALDFPDMQLEDALFLINRIKLFD